MSMEASTRSWRKKTDLLANDAEVQQVLGAEISRELALENGEKVTVVDTAQLIQRLRKVFGSGAGRSDEDTEKLVQRVASMFRKPVLTEEQVARGDVKPRHLFYVPDSVAAASSQLSIKKAQFHLLLPRALDKLRLRVPQPLSHAEGDVMTLLEATTGVVIFHPEYGDGFRDEKGVLYVRLGADREYAKFSGTFLEQHGIHKNYFHLIESMHGGRAGDRSLREGMVAELPHLISNGLINPARDLKQITLGSDSIEGRTIERSGVSPSGSRMMRGVLHYIGREYYGKPIRISDISPELGCVIDETNPLEPRVVALFTIVTKNNAKKGTGTYLANKDMTKPRPFTAEAAGLSKLHNETDLQFQERCEAIDRGIAHLLLTTARKHVAVAELFKSASPSLLAEVAKTAYWLEKRGNKDLFDTFIQSYGSNGLRTFLSMEHDRSMGDKILEFATSSADERLKQEVFALYGKIIDAGNDATSAMVAEKIGKRAQQLLANAHSYKDDPEKLRQSLQKLSVEGQVLLGTFRALAEEKKVQAVTEVAGVEYAIDSGEELLQNESIRTSLEKLYISNYEGVETHRVLIAEFRKNLSQPGARVHRVMFRGKVVAFMLLVPRGEKRLHVSALNVDKELVGVKAGPELLKKVLGLVQEGNTIEAEATKELAPQYSRQYGFSVGKRYVADDGVELFTLELRPPSTAPSSTAPRTESDEVNK